MPFALNYSLPAADLIRQGVIDVDFFKCPAWVDTVREARELRPTYIHFPLIVTDGSGAVLHGEKGLPVDYHDIESLLRASDTHYINIHLNPNPANFPDIPLHSTEPAHEQRIIESLVADVAALVREFSADRVIAENDHHGHGRYILAACQPHVISQVINEAGCGLLLDVSHARLAAGGLGMGAREYIAQLPVDRLKEIHITGIQQMTDDLADHFKSLGINDSRAERYRNQWIDHVSLVDDDWAFMAWVAEQIQSGAWAQPWMVSLEYGGVGGFWEKIAEPEILQAQIPRLYALFGERVSE